MSACDCNYHDGRATKRGALGRAMEAREATRRVQEAAREEIHKYYGEQKYHDTAATGMLKDDFKRKGREFKERAAESQMLENLYQNERTRQLSHIRAEEEEKLTTVLVQRQMDQDRSQKEIQKLREQSDELRALAEKVRIARMNKERSEQLVEKKQLQQQQAAYEQAFNSFVQQSDQAAVAKEAEHQTRRREQNVQTRMVLEEQMQEKQEALKQAEQEHARERNMIDEVVQRIMDEDMAGAALKRQKQDETKAFIERFLAERDDQLRRKREAEQAETQKIQAYWNQVKERETAEASRQADRKEVADRMYEKVKREMEMEMRRREEEEELINMLRQEELEAKRRAEDQGRKLKAEQMKQEMIRANQYQMKLKEEREAAMKAEEEDFRLRMMAKFAEDDRVEQMNAQKRRMRIADHAREVQLMIDDKRRLYEEQKARDEANVAAQLAEEERQRAIIEEQRRLLLREAAELRDYLPRGVLRDQADVDFVNSVMRGTSLGN